MHTGDNSGRLCSECSETKDGNRTEADETVDFPARQLVSLLSTLSEKYMMRKVPKWW
jgi:hypothetical protein